MSTARDQVANLNAHRAHQERIRWLYDRAASLDEGDLMWVVARLCDAQPEAVEFFLARCTHPARDQGMPPVMSARGPARRAGDAPPAPPGPSAVD